MVAGKLKSENCSCIYCILFVLYRFLCQRRERAHFAKHSMGFEYFRMVAVVRLVCKMAKSDS